ncbi:hypothetical protein DL93DRAFT_2092201 [Clavulina sp. PMI_390]|nr:hypothetical protein DL93DRAFT_2092201 [Clavulina sp. PMI_390]
MEDERLDFIRRGKAAQAEHIRTVRHSHSLPTSTQQTSAAVDFVDPDSNHNDDNDDNDYNNEDEFVNLPASFTGSPKYFAEQTADALALSRQRGKPDLMITATTNPRWPELLEQLKPGQSATEVPHITCCVFKVCSSAPWSANHTIFLQPPAASKHIF